MPIFEYRCENGHTTDTMTRGASTECDVCYATAKRVFGFSYKPAMPEHFNPTTGTYVPNEQAFKDDLKRASEKATLRTGIEHNYTPTDPTDMKSAGVTQEGLDATYDTATPEVRKKLAKYL